MTLTRTMSLVPEVSQLPRGLTRRSRANAPLLVAVVVLLTVLIADALLIAFAAPSVTKLGALYLTAI